MYIVQKTFFVSFMLFFLQQPVLLQGDSYKNKHDETRIERVIRAPIRGLANMVKHDLFITALTAYFYVHRHNYPEASALLCALWFGDLIWYTAHSYGYDSIKNSFIKTLVDHPFLTGLLISGCFHQDLAERWSIVGLGVGGWLAYSWADNFL